MVFAPDVCQDRRNGSPSNPNAWNTLVFAVAIVLVVVVVIILVLLAAVDKASTPVRLGLEAMPPEKVLVSARICREPKRE
jgi:hypothetical protein